ncbi:helix-turn-helix transcriptional regulator [Streptomyces sp. NPDC048330]|uniref:helix-turn-helix transcriptional regulator n=1 Tax=Streptomyces sp. NPDC048330 TaxID=3365533 RepID=UPI0037204C57
MWEDLGLTPVEESVYRMLIGRPDASVAEVVAESGAPHDPPGAVVTLESLEARGLVTRTPDGTRFMATSPTETLGAELVERRERLHRAELALAGLVEAYRVGSMGRGQRELMEIVEGTEAVRRRYVHMQLTARSSIDFFSTGGHRAVGPESTQEARALQRGVRLRGVVDEEFLSQPSGSDNLDAALVEGTCVRTVRAIPLKLIICDGEVAMMPLHGQGTEVNPSLVLRGGPVNVARALFEAVWERARPYTERTWEIEAVDARLMRLLLAGLTDTTAAAQLGLSTRTVQRRIQALMVRAGVSTRLQLGWHARDHRWV